MRTPIRTLVPALAALLLSAACQLPPVNDPNAIAPDYQRWRAVMPGGAPETFQRAVRVLVDSGYTVAHASPEVGVVVTQLRVVRPPRGDAHGAFRIQLRVEPAGPDSSAVILTADSCVGDANERCYRVDARTPAWSELQRIGDAIAVGR